MPATRGKPSAAAQARKKQETVPIDIAGTDPEMAETLRGLQNTAYSRNVAGGAIAGATAGKPAKKPLFPGFKNPFAKFFKPDSTKKKP